MQRGIHLLKEISIEKNQEIISSYEETRVKDFLL